MASPSMVHMNRQALLAKDDQANPLNEFNLHEDAERGPHYHVTPGKFPHIIGGFWGVAEMRRGGPPGGGRPVLVAKWSPRRRTTRKTF